MTKSILSNNKSLAVLLLASLFTQCSLILRENIKTEIEEAEELVEPSRQKEKKIEETSTPSLEYLAEIKKEKIPASRPANLDFRAFSTDVLYHIISYVAPNCMNAVRNIDSYLYKHTTGYERPGKIGIEHAPYSAATHIKAWKLNTKTIDFSKKPDLITDNVLSMPFYQLTGTVSYLPAAFWPYIKYTKINTLDASWCFIDDQTIIALVKNLPGSQVTTLDVSMNKISFERILEIVEILQNTTQVSRVYLCGNQISPKQKEELIKLVGNNQKNKLELIFDILRDKCNEETIKSFKNLLGTQVHALDLTSNQIENEVLIELVKDLPAIYTYVESNS